MRGGKFSTAGDGTATFYKGVIST